MLNNSYANVSQSGRNSMACDHEIDQNIFVDSQPLMQTSNPNYQSNLSNICANETDRENMSSLQKI